MSITAGEMAELFVAGAAAAAAFIGIGKMIFGGESTAKALAELKTERTVKDEIAKKEVHDTMATHEKSDEKFHAEINKKLDVVMEKLDILLNKQHEGDVRLARVETELDIRRPTPIEGVPAIRDGGKG